MTVHAGHRPLTNAEIAARVHRDAFERQLAVRHDCGPDDWPMLILPEVHERHRMYRCPDCSWWRWEPRATSTATIRKD